MREIDEIKNRIKNKGKNEKKESYFFIKLILISILFFLLLLIVNKNDKIKTEIYQKVFNDNISFALIKEKYNKYLGNVIPFSNNIETKKVFKEKLTYKNLSNYNKGVKLTLDNNLVPALKGGIVIFDGKKDNMNTIIIQQSNNIDVIYQNFSNKNVKLYDYVSDNEILGEVKNNTLFLTFKKDGVEIDYKEIIK